jgi:hypothetical protein
MSFELTEDKKEFARKIIGKALSDSEFKERLMEDSASAIREIHPDYNLAENTHLEVIDQTKLGTIYINISALEFVLYGGNIEDIELTPEQLEAVAGGQSCNFLSCFINEGGGKEK